MLLFENEEFAEHLKSANISIYHVKEAIKYAGTVNPKPTVTRTVNPNPNADLDGDGRIDYKEFLEALETMDEASARRDAWELANKVRQLDKEIETNHQVSFVTFTM